MVPGKKRTILLVEDEAVTALQEKSNLETYGYQVKTAGSGEKAVKTALADDSLDLILMDIDLGEGIDGTEAAAQILKEKDIPVVFLSSHTDPNIVSLTEKITSYGYVVKNSGTTVLDASIKMAFKLFEANSAVREKERLLLSIADNYPNSFISIIEEDFTISFSSGQEFKNQGLDPESFNGFTLAQIFNDQAEKVKKYYQRTFQGEECSFELFINNQFQLYKTVPLYSESGKISQILSVVENITSRKLIEEQLIESKEKFRQVYDHMSVGIAHVSLDFTIINANEAYCKMLGYTEDELIGKTLKEITHPTSLKENITKQKKLADGKLDYFRIKKTFIHKKGSIVTGILDANLIRDSRNRPLYFIGSVLDITESEKAEKELQNNRERFAVVMEAVQEGLWDWDIPTNHVYFSPAYTNMLGYSSENLPPHFDSWVNLLHPDDKDKSLQVINDCIKGGCDNFQIEFRMKTVDGSYLWILGQGKVIHKDSTGKALRLTGTHTDITERKKIEAGLKRSQDLLESIFFNIQGISYRCALDTNWTMQFMSPYTEHLTGYPAEDFIDNTVRSYESIIHRDDTEFVEKEILKAVGDNLPWEIEYRILHKDGNIRHIYEKGKAIKNFDGSIDYLDGLIIDISEKTVMEEKIKESEALFSRFMDFVPGAVFIKDRSDRLLFVNEYMKKHFGADTWLGKTAHEIFPNDLAEQMTADDKLTYSSGYQKAVENITHINKSNHIYETQKFIIERKSGLPLLGGIAVDITDRVNSENLLRESKEKLLQSQFIAGLGDFTWNISSGTVIWSEGMYKLLKYNLNEKIDYTKVNESILHPDDLESVTQWLNDSIDSGKEVSAPKEFRLVQKDGNILYVQANGRIHYQNGKAELFFGTCLDITQRKIAEVKLQESENRYRLLADNSADLVWTCGTKEDNFQMTYINPAVEEMLGYPVDIFLSLPLQKRWTEDSLKIFEDSLDNISRTGETGVFQLQYLHRNRRIVNCEVWVKPVKEADGTLTGFQGRTIDITVRKMAEEMLAEQTGSLVRRVNELNCLYGLSKLIENTEAPIEEIYIGAVKLIPSAWQYPKKTCAKLVFNNRQYTTRNYQETPWQIKADIYVHNRLRGELTAGYLNEYPEADDGPFLKEEKTLLNEIAERLGRLTAHRNAEAEIKSLLNEKNILLKEIHHRIKNNMAMVEGLLSLQVDSIDNPEAVSALNSSINRVTGMRLLYDKLIITDDYKMLSVPQYIHDLLDSIFTTFTHGDNITVSREISDFELNSKILFPLGIILNELLTNVLKYAFKADDEGIIKISITREENHVTLSIQDNGKGLPDDFDATAAAKGFGLLLVQMLTKQLRGTFTINGGSGTTSILTFDKDQ